MKYDPTKALRPFPNVRAMLKDIPQQLWDIFLPESLTGLPGLESNILALRAREVDRKKVMAIQQMCGFPFRPNAPLREMAAKVKILRMKNGKFEKGGNDSDTAERK